MNVTRSLLPACLLFGSGCLSSGALPYEAYPEERLQAAVRLAWEGPLGMPPELLPVASSFDGCVDDIGVEGACLSVSVTCSTEGGCRLLTRAVGGSLVWRATGWSTSDLAYGLDQARSFWTAGTLHGDLDLDRELAVDRTLQDGGY